MENMELDMLQVAACKNNCQKFSLKIRLGVFFLSAFDKMT